MGKAKRKWSKFVFKEYSHEQLARIKKYYAKLRMLGSETNQQYSTMEETAESANTEEITVDWEPTEPAEPDEPLSSEEDLNDDYMPEDYEEEFNIFGFANEIEHENIPYGLFNSPVFHGSRNTLISVVLGVVRFHLKHHLSLEALDHLIQFIHTILPNGNGFPKSLYLFYKLFCKYPSNVAKVKTCTLCKRLVKVTDKKCPSCSAKQSEHQRTLGTDYFLSFNIENTLQQIFRRLENDGTNIVEMIANSKKIEDEDLISDITNAAIYREFDAETVTALSKVLPKSNSISFLGNTDGIPVGNHSLWPLYLVINEIDVMQRFKLPNVIVALLWYGDGHPNFQEFLRPLIYQLQKLFNVGFNVTLSSCTVTGKAFWIASVVDLPAAAAFLQVKGHSGYFSCWSCHIEGQLIGTKVKFPDTTLIARTHTERLLSMANPEVLEDEDVNEFTDDHAKSCTPLVKLPYINLVKHVSGDTMHICWLGVTKLMMKLWFKSSYVDEPWSLRENLTRVNDDILSAIRWPSKFTRPIYEITQLDNQISWKAIQYYVFALYLFVPLMKPTTGNPGCSLKSQYFEHYLKFVEAMILLHRKSGFEKTWSTEVANLLTTFVTSMIELYGIEFCPMVVHRLLHLVDEALLFGPTFAHSCWQFENLNGLLLHCFHGTGHFLEQAARSFYLNRVASYMEMNITGIEEDSPPLHKLLVKLGSNSSTCEHNVTTKFLKCHTVEQSFSDTIIKLFEHQYTVTLSPNYTVQYYQKFNQKGETLHSIAYDTDKKSFNSCVEFQFGSKVLYGLVQFFVLISDNDKCYRMALVETLQTVPVLPNNAILRDCYHQVLKKDEL